MVVVKWAELYEPLPLTVSGVVNAAAPEHVASSGPKRAKVNVPEGFDPLLRLTLSKISRPTVVLDDAVERIVSACSAPARARRSRRSRQEAAPPPPTVEPPYAP